MLSPELIKQIKDSNFYPELVEYLASKIIELNSFEGLEKLDNEKAGEEAKVRIKAINKLQDILRPFLEERNKKEPTAEEINKAKGKYGL